MTQRPPDYSAVRIVASPEGMFVHDANRQAVPGVFSVDMALRPGRPPVVRLNMVCGNFDVAGKPVFAVADPATGQPRMVRRIEWMDGTAFDAPDVDFLMVMGAGPVANGNGGPSPASDNSEQPLDPPAGHD